MRTPFVCASLTALSFACSHPARTASSLDPGGTTLVRVVMEKGAIDFATLSQARMRATLILGEAGVQVKWAVRDCDGGCSERPVGVRFVGNAPPDLPPGVLALALPYASDKVSITVFVDRLKPRFTAMPNTRGTFLGHVLAHELVHVLQGMVRHSEQGLMKAQWIEKDVQMMAVKPFCPTSDDVDLIRRGMMRLRTLALNTAGAAVRADDLPE